MYKRQDEERQKLKEYTMKAIIFAEHLGANNIVFGSPRNRVISNADNFKQAILFFKELGNYACKHHTVLSIEASRSILFLCVVNLFDPYVVGVEALHHPGQPAVEAEHQVDAQAVVRGVEERTAFFPAIAAQLLHVVHFLQVLLHLLQKV